MKVQPKDTRRGHFYVSLLKSVVRIGAGTALMFAGISWLVVAGVCLVIAEILGIVEELV
jgi:hypothetical protein